MKKIACIDLEGVLIPEMWPYIGQIAGIPALSKTTREVPDYPQLMAQRITLLRQHGLNLQTVQKIVAHLPALPGAIEFLAKLREQYQILIVSDAFHDMVDQYRPAFGMPEFQCHRLHTDANGFINGCEFLPRAGKQDVIRGLQAQGYHTLAVGDALNDLAMLRLADQGFLFAPSEQTRRQAPDLTLAHSYEDILHRLDELQPA